MQDWLHSWGLCRFLYLLISQELPMQHIQNRVWSKPLDGADPWWNEVETKLLQNPKTKNFRWNRFSHKDAVKMIFYSSPHEPWTHFFTFLQELCKIECKVIIKTVTEAQWEGKSVWPVYRGMVSCRPGSQPPQSSSLIGRGVQSLYIPQKPQKSS